MADLRGAQGTHAPCPRVQILSISCSFWEILAKSYVGPPPEGWCPNLGEIQDPPLHLTCLKLGLSQNAEEINTNFLNNVYHTQQKIDWNTKLIDICHIVNLVSCAKTSIEGGISSKCRRGKTAGSVSGGSWPHLFCFQNFVIR